MQKFVRKALAATGAVALALIAVTASATPASAGDCSSTQVTGTVPGGYKAAAACVVEGHNMIFSAVGNTPADAQYYAAWMGSQATGNSGCPDATVSAIPGGYNVVLSCFGSYSFPNATGPDLNTATASASE